MFHINFMLAIAPLIKELRNTPRVIIQICVYLSVHTITAAIIYIFN